MLPHLSVILMILLFNDIVIHSLLNYKLMNLDVVKPMVGLVKRCNEACLLITINY